MDVSDHFIVLAFGVAYPTYGALTYPGLLKRVDAGVPNARVRIYVRVIVVQWILAVGAVAWWLARDRPLAALGIQVGDGRAALLGGVLFAVLAGLARLQIRTLVRDSDLLRQLRVQLEREPRLRGVFPQTPSELRLFMAVSLTAGVCEEVLFRGYLLAHLEAVGLDRFVAAGVGALWFGLAHAYQGVSGMAKTTVVGLALMALYLWTGSLWISMAVHTLIDVRAGVLGWLVRQPLASPPG